MNTIIVKTIISMAVLVVTVKAVYAVESLSDKPEADTFIILGKADKAYPVYNSMSVLRDPTKELTIWDVSSPEYADEFEENASGIPQYGISKAAFWLRFTIAQDSSRFDSDEVQWKLDTGRSYLMNATLYIPGQHGNWIPQRRGYKETISYKAHHFIIKPTLQPKTYYLRIASETTLHLPIKIMSHRTFLKKRERIRFLFGGYYGLIISLTVFNLFMFLSLRKRIYLLYSLYVFCVGIYFLSINGILMQVILPETPELAVRIGPFALGVGLSAIILFTRLFLDTRKHIPLMDHFFKVFFVFVAGITVIIPFFSLQLVGSLFSIAGMVSAASIILASLLVIPKTQRPVKFFFSAWLIFGVFGIFYSLTYRGLLPYSVLGINGFQIGSAIEVFLLSFALADQVNLLRIEKESAQLQLEKYSRNLETMVEERTRELEIANRHLRLLDRRKTDFVASVSHELRTPLTSVLGFTQIIKNKFQSVIFPAIHEEEDNKLETTLKQIESNFDIIISEGNRLTRLINNVLDIARMESGAFEWNFEKLSLADVVQHSLSVSENLFDSKPVTLKSSIEDNIPLITGDRERLVQVVVNLLSNAAKFTDKGEVVCRVYQNNDTIVVSVSDTGRGIPESDLTRIFDRFRQVEDILPQRIEGSGLGLAISREIIEQHGGKLKVESIVGIGSTFSFSIPATPDSE